MLLRSLAVALSLVFLVTSCETPGDDGSTDDLLSPSEDTVSAQDTIGADSAADTVAWLDQTWPELPEPGVTGIFDPDSEGFFDQPFPLNSRRKAGGNPDLHNFPNPYGVDLIDQMVAKVEKEVDGFSPAGTIYFRFSGALDEGLFPTPEGSLGPESPLFLVDVDPESRTYGVRVPVEVQVYDRDLVQEGYYIEPWLLMVKPLAGFPLRHGTTYGLFIKRSLLDAQGLSPAPAPALDAILRGEDKTGKQALALAPGLAWAGEEGSLKPWDIAMMTVFTTSNPTREFQVVADYLMGLPEGPKVEAPAVQVGDNEFYLRFEGSYLAPNFQYGEPPYDKYGQFVFNSEGEPFIQWYEEIPFTLLIPKTTMPAGGWPLVMYSHGTGGNNKSFVSDGTGIKLAQDGIASIGIDQPLHGPRYKGPEVDLTLYSFNFFNIDSGRTLFRQAALDNLSLHRFVREELRFDYGDGQFKVDPARIGFFGHSQGGLVGALNVAVDPDLSAAVLSGGGGGLAYTIMLRKDISGSQSVDLKVLVQTVMGITDDEELTVFHPLMTLLQTLVDVTDPISYSPRFFEDRMRETLVPILVTEGVDDPYTPAITTESMALAAGIPLVGDLLNANPGFDLAALQPQDWPQTGNILTSDGLTTTSGLVQFTGFGHFPVFKSQDAIKIWRHFVGTALLDNAAELNL